MPYKIKSLNLFNKTILLVFTAALALLPSWHFMTPITVWFMDGQRILELLLLSLVLLETTIVKQAELNNERYILFSVKKRYALFILLVLTLVSCSLAISSRHALIEVSIFASLVYFSLYVARLFNENHTVFLKYFLTILWGSVLLYMVSFYVGYTTAMVFRTPLNWPQPFNGFTNVRHFNQYQLWGLGLISLPLLSFDIKKSGRIWLQIVLSAWWVLLFYSASRGVLIAWFLGLVITIAIYRELAWSFLKLQLLQISTGFLAYYLLFKALPAFLHYNLVTGTVIRETTSDRLGLWFQALDLIKASPSFGVGPMHFAWYSQLNAHPHNSVLQIAAEFGLPAAFIIYSIGIYAIGCWVKLFSANNLKTQSVYNSQLAIVLFFTIIANFAYSLVDGVIVMPISQVLMFTIIGLMMGHYFYNNANILQSMSYRNSNLSRIFAAIVLLIMTWSTLPEIKQGLSNNEKGFSMGYTAQGPRFWREIK